MKEVSDLKIQQRKRAYEKENVRKVAEQKFDGAWFKKYQTQTDLLEDERETVVGASLPGRMIDQFIEYDEDDEDIYKQYQEMASRSHENQPASFSGFTPDKDQLKPETPRFDEYFKSQAEGVHPFDKTAASFDQSEIRGDDETLMEEQRESELYKREIVGRLIGRSLSPNEYELIAGINEGNLKQRRYLDSNNDEFLDTRH